MAIKYRSASNWASTYSSNKQGIAIGIENFVFVKEETVPGTFVPPTIGTQGSSISDATPDADISAGTDTKITISVDGGANVVATLLSVASLTTGPLIATALEAAINLALSTAGQDGRVWVEYASSLYKVYSQKTGLNSSVVITDGPSLNVADDLKLGVPNAGIEAEGTECPDFLYMQKAGIKYSQAIEPSKHRSGRQVSSIIKKKKMVEGDLEMYVNFDTSGGTPDLDPAVELVLESVFGRKTSSASEIVFDSADPQTNFISMLQCSNSFSRILNGGYVKNWTLTLPGDGEASMKMSLKGRDSKEATLAQIDGIVAASTDVVVNAGEAKRYEPNGLVMIVDPDGRTVLAGMDGSLYVVSTNTGTDTVTLSAPVSVADNGYIAPWCPNVLGVSGIDNPVTGLQGSVSFEGGSNPIEEIRSCEISFDYKAEDQDNYYGADGNRGYVIGDRSDIKVKVEMLLSASQYQKIIESKSQHEYSMKVVLGDSTSRHMQIICPRVIYNSPAVELPDSGSVVVTFEGIALQTAVGTNDAISVKFV